MIFNLMESPVSDYVTSDILKVMQPNTSLQKRLKQAKEKYVINQNVWNSCKTRMKMSMFCKERES